MNKEQKEVYKSFPLSLQKDNRQENGPGTLLAPTPVVLVSVAGKEEDRTKRDFAGANLITVAWAGIINSDPPMLSISVRPERYSHELLLLHQEFVVNLVSTDLAAATDYCGVVSGRDLDKFAATGLSPVPAAKMTSTPAVAESPLSLSCKVVEKKELGSHTLFIGEIVAVEVQSGLLDANNALRLERANLVCYQHGQYYEVGEKLGFFGYSVAKPAVRKRRMGR